MKKKSTERFRKMKRTKTSSKKKVSEPQRVLPVVTEHEALQRLKRARGHLDKVISMIEAGRGIAEILQQLSAVIAALGSCRSVLFSGHLKQKLRIAFRSATDTSVDPLVDEIEKLSSRVFRSN